MRADYLKLTSAGEAAFDLDSTLAIYTKYQGPGHIGAPIQAMIDKVHAVTDAGYRPIIFTARCYPLNDCIEPDVDVDALVEGIIRIKQAAPNVFPNLREWVEEFRNAATNVKAIRAFCIKHIGVPLPVSNVKTRHIRVFYEDRAIAVIPNTGEIVGDGIIRASKSHF